MTTEEIRAIIQQEIENIAPEADLTQLQDEDDMREALDLDSMDIFNLIVALSQRLKIDIPDMDAGQLVTMKGAVDYLKTRA